jgi:hypothetical protein
MRSPTPRHGPKSEGLYARRRQQSKRAGDESDPSTLAERLDQPQVDRVVDRAGDRVTVLCANASPAPPRLVGAIRAWRRRAAGGVTARLRSLPASEVWLLLVVLDWGLWTHVAVSGLWPNSRRARTDVEQVRAGEHDLGSWALAAAATPKRW